MARVESERSSHAGSASDGPDGWGERGREIAAILAAVGTPAGRAFATRIESMQPGEAAVELRAMFAPVPSKDLGASIAADLLIDPAKAEMIAAEIAAARRRLGRATRPFRHAAARS